MVITTSPSRATSMIACGIAAMSSTNTGSTLPATRSARGQRAAVGRDDGRFAGGIDLRQTQRIDRAQHLDEILEAVARARVAVRLESQHQAASREGTPGSGQRGGHFDRVMTVVVDQREAAAARQGHFAIALEAAADPLELGQGLDDGFVGHLHLGGHGDGRQGVEHIVHTRQC